MNDSLSVLSAEERRVYAELKRRELALLSPMEYGVYCSDMERYDHIIYIDSLVVAAQSGRLYKSGIGPRAVFVPDPEADPEAKDFLYTGRWEHPETGEPALFRIGFSEPPRHGKSFHISQHLPAWFLTKYPDLSVHLASYEATFAAEWGQKARELVEEHPELGQKVNPEARANAMWRMAGHRGFMKTAGIRGPLTGSGRHLGIIDDYVKNDEEALSETVRKGHINWYISTWRNRREPHPARLRMLYPDSNHPDIFCVDIVMATRWHQDDLTGWLKENENHRWYFVNLPALAFDDPHSPDYGDPKRCVLGRKPGTPLCPQRMSRTDLLAELDSAEGRFWFNAQYQGIPKVDGGGIIGDSFHSYQILPGPRGQEVYHLDTGEQIPAFKCMRFATVDLAATTKTSSDYTVFAVWDVTPGPDRKLLLRAQFRLKVESSEHVKLVENWDKRFSPKFVGVEDRTFGTTLIQNLRKRRTVRVRPLPADTDKVTRALQFGFLVGDELVYLPEHAEWLQGWLDEMEAFPNGSHDDQVDCAAYAAVEFERIPKTAKSEGEQHHASLEDKVRQRVDKRIKDRDRARKRVRRVRYR